MKLRHSFFQNWNMTVNAQRADMWRGKSFGSYDVEAYLLVVISLIICTIRLPAMLKAIRALICPLLIVLLAVRC